MKTSDLLIGAGLVFLLTQGSEKKKTKTNQKIISLKDLTFQAPTPYLKNFAKELERNQQGMFFLPENILENTVLPPITDPKLKAWKNRKQAICFLLEETQKKWSKSASAKMGKLVSFDPENIPTHIRAGVFYAASLVAILDASGVLSNPSFQKYVQKEISENKSCEQSFWKQLLEVLDVLKWIVKSLGWLVRLILTGGTDVTTWGAIGASVGVLVQKVAVDMSGEGDITKVKDINEELWKVIADLGPPPMSLIHYLNVKWETQKSKHGGLYSCAERYSASGDGYSAAKYCFEIMQALSLMKAQNYPIDNIFRDYQTSKDPTKIVTYSSEWLEEKVLSSTGNILWQTKDLFNVYGADNFGWRYFVDQTPDTVGQVFLGHCRGFELNSSTKYALDIPGDSKDTREYNRALFINTMWLKYYFAEKYTGSRTIGCTDFSFDLKKYHSLQNQKSTEIMNWFNFSLQDSDFCTIKKGYSVVPLKFQGTKRKGIFRQLYLGIGDNRNWLLSAPKENCDKVRF